MHRNNINNVTLGNDTAQEKLYFPCPVCKKELLVKTSKKNKPYCQCNDCGIQLFIRGKEGIKKICDLLKNDLFLKINL